MLLCCLNTYKSPIECIWQGLEHKSAPRWNFWGLRAPHCLLEHCRLICWLSNKFWTINIEKVAFGNPSKIVLSFPNHLCGAIYQWNIHELAGLLIRKTPFFPCGHGIVQAVPKMATPPWNSATIASKWGLKTDLRRVKPSQITCKILSL